MAERFFSKVANDVLQASEHLSNRLEEGVSAILTGELPKEQEEAPNTGDNEEDEFEMIDEDLMNSPLEGIAESVMGDIIQGQATGPQTPMEHFQAFRSAITWSETFIIALITFQAVMFALSLWVSRRDRGLAPRLTVMFLIAGIVRTAERLNTYGAQHWQQFCTQNYFDRRGIFVSVMVCAPLLLDSLIMLLLFLREASQLLVQVKTAELKKKRQEKSKEEKNGKDKRRAKKDQ